MPDYACSYMFQYCSRLTAAPDLPATTVGTQCYAHMFDGCTGLTTPPAILPATSLTESCYLSMFLGCSSLTTVPALPATTLAKTCYSQMFKSCTSLTALPVLPAVYMIQGCYTQMFYGCSQICLSSSYTGDYTNVYRLPYSGYASGATSFASSMFANTGGTFTGSP